MFAARNLCYLRCMYNAGIPIYHECMADKYCYMVDFGKKLRISRLHSGLTQEELAEMIGVSRGSIARYELGEMEPKISNLIALANALNVSVDYLLGVEKENHVWKALNSLLSAKAINRLKDFVEEVMKTANDRREET